MASAGFTHALTDQVAAALESDDAEAALKDLAQWASTRRASTPGFIPDFSTVESAQRF